MANNGLNSVPYTAIYMAVSSFLTLVFSPYQQPWPLHLQCSRCHQIMPVLQNYARAFCSCKKSKTLRNWKKVNAYKKRELVHFRSISRKIRNCMIEKLDFRRFPEMGVAPNLEKNPSIFGGKTTWLEPQGMPPWWTRREKRLRHCDRPYRRRRENDGKRFRDVAEIMGDVWEIHQKWLFFFPIEKHLNNKK